MVELAENKANSAQLELKLGLSLAKNIRMMEIAVHYTLLFFIRTKFIRTSKLELSNITKNICKLDLSKNTLLI